jgi:hypothetical protein
MQTPGEPRAMLGSSVATGFELLGDGSVRAVIPAEARQAATRTASVVLPVHANGPVRIEDDVSHVAVSFAMRGAGDMAITVAGGVATYPGALSGADVLHRVHAAGTEDYVLFEERPGREELAYDVDVSRVAGLRLVSNTLEFLDEGGVPRLRVAPPYVVDAKGVLTEGALALGACAFDVSPRGPWGRTVTPPGASRCEVRVTWKAASYPAMVDPNWSTTASLATARSNHTATMLGSGQVLVAAGYGPAGATSSAELYDPTSSTFTSTASMIAPREYHAAALLDSGDVLIAGGSNGSAVALSSAEIYDPTAATFTDTGVPMTTARESLTATLLPSGGKVLLTGGCIGTCPSGLSSAELYDPIADTFTSTSSSMTSPRALHTATLYGSTVLLVGGIDGGGSAQASAEIYDPSADTFTATGSMATAREYHTATALSSGDVLVAGGFNGSGALSSAEVYGSTLKFTIVGSMTTPRADPSAALLATGTVLIAGGCNGSCGAGLASAEYYDPTAKAFTATGSMADMRLAATATLLGTGAVLVAGGFDGTSVLSDAELFACLTACASGYDCGSIPDGCGGNVACGSACTAPQTCGGGGAPNVCGCTPLLGCPFYDDCGTISDGCGGTLHCGSACTPPETCGGHGKPNMCGCTPKTCPAADSCGTLPDGCGGTVACGTCFTGQTCSANKCVSGGTDAGTGGKDSGREDSGKEDSGREDSGMASSDSGPGSRDSGSVIDAGPHGSMNQQVGCSCRTAPQRHVGSYAVLALGCAGAAGMRRLRRRSRR